MEKKDIFQDIQNIRSSNPVIVLGSGASVSYGIPGMGVLANELKNFFKSNPYYDTATNDVVSDFIKLLDSGVGLEAALLDVKVPEIVEADIVKYNAHYLLVTENSQHGKIRNEPIRSAGLRTKKEMQFP